VHIRVDCFDPGKSPGSRNDNRGGVIARSRKAATFAKQALAVFAPSQLLHPLGLSVANGVGLAISEAIMEWCCAHPGRLLRPWKISRVSQRQSRRYHCEEPQSGDVAISEVIVEWATISRIFPLFLPENLHVSASLFPLLTACFFSLNPLSYLRIVPRTLPNSYSPGSSLTNIRYSNSNIFFETNISFRPS